ncbi:MAG: anti-sigma F factor [Ruminococcaceae bacterium]|nr:anti-sigma F factor [Oscillospiraceae bacterium]
MKKINQLKMVFDSKSVNESFSRVAVGAFSSQLDMTVEELGDIKTVVSEAVTNCIVHAYGDNIGNIYITCTVFEEGVIRISIRDKGCGMEDVKKAMEPLYTSKGGDRSGLGFSVMECFSDKLKVRSKPGVGTTVTVEKKIKGKVR